MFIFKPVGACITMILIQSSLCLPLVAGQTCPPREAKVTITDQGGNRSPDDWYVAFDDSNCRYGLSRNGDISLNNCAQTNTGATTVAFRQFLFGTSPDTPTVTLVVKNEDKPEQNAAFAFVRSAAGTAVLVALITGLFGQLSPIGCRNEDSDMSSIYRNSISAPNRIGLGFQKNWMMKGMLSIRLIDLLGTVSGGGDDLLAIGTAEFQRPGANVATAKQKLWSNFEEAERNWKNERYSTGLLIKLHHPGQNRIQEIWTQIDSGIAEYFDVCKQRYDEFNNKGMLVTEQVKTSVRSDHVSKILAQLECLTREIADARQSSTSNLESAAVAT